MTATVLDELRNTCCRMMAANVTDQCDTFKHAYGECPDQVVVRWDDGTYGLPVRDGGSSIITIKYCPWCGTDIS